MAKASPLRAAVAAAPIVLGLAALALWAGIFYMRLSPAHQGPLSKKQNLRRRLGASFEQKAEWTRGRRCSGGEMHELLFVLRPRNLDKLEALVMDITDPSSPNYRQWVSRTQLGDLTRNEDALSALRAALAEHPDVQLLREAPGGESLRASARTRTWERLLNTEFHMWQHPAGEAVAVHATDFMLPQSLQAHIDDVLEATDFEFGPASRSPGTISAVDSHETRDTLASFGYDSFEQLERHRGEDIISPTKLRKIYNMPPISERGTDLAEQESQASQVVFGTIGQHWSPSDRTTFEEAFKIPQDKYVKQLHGEKEGFAMSGDATCRANPNGCLEANLDVQYIMAMAPWADTGYWYTPNASAGGMYQFLVDFSERFADAETVPDVISISYGVAELLVPEAVTRLFDLQAMKLAARGVTVLVASGDSGADGASDVARNFGDSRCLHLDMPKLSLQVDWPAASRWVTAVGATLLLLVAATRSR